MNIRRLLSVATERARGGHRAGKCPEGLVTWKAPSPLDWRKWQWFREGNRYPRQGRVLWD